MAGTIIISRSCSFDLRTVDFAWLASQLQLHTGVDEKVLAKVLWSHDVAGMDMLNADELNEEEFKIFTRALKDVLDAFKVNAKGAMGMKQFLESLISAIENDPRY